MSAQSGGGRAPGRLAEDKGVGCGFVHCLPAISFRKGKSGHLTCKGEDI